MLNHIVLQGRLTRDPELRYTDYTHAALASFSLAVERDVKDQDGNKKTDFISCIAWKGTAEFASKYFKKGQMAIVVGRLEVQPYTDKDGNKRRDFGVRVNNIYFADSKKEGQAPAAPSPAQAEPVPAAGEFVNISAEDDGDLPF